MKLMTNVLIKLMKGGHTDRILIIDNVPEEYFYTMAYPRMCVGKGAEQHWEPDMSKERILTLHEELRLSQTGDGAIMFDLDNNQARDRFYALHRYMLSVTPVNQKVVEPVPNSTDQTDPRAGILPQDMIPRAVLPVLSPPSGAQENPSKVALAAGTVGAALNLDVEAIKAQAVAEYKEQETAKVKERLALARAAKASKD